MNLRFSLFVFGVFAIGGFEPLAWAQEPEPASPPAAVVAEKPAEAQPSQPAAVSAPDSAPASATAVEPAASEAESKAEAAPAPEKPKSGKRKHQAGHQNNAVVNIGRASTLGAGEKADAVVAVLGSASSAGEVADAVVSILGNTRVTGGSVGDAAVAILGNLHVNSHVKGDAVAVLGNVDLGPDAIVDGEVVCIGGKVTRHANAVIRGGVENVGIGNGPSFSGLATWFTECILRGRLLAFDAAVTWAWVIAGLFLGFYLLLALVLPGAVNRSVQTLEQQPGSTVLTAVLTLVLTPVAYLLLVFTLLVGVGFVLIPVFSLGLFLLGLFGTAVMLAWIGRRGTALLGLAEAPPVLAVLLGGLVAMLLYATPWVGILIYKLIGILGLGTVIYTLITLAKTKKAAAVVLPLPVTTSMPATAENAATWAAETAGLPPVVSAATLPRAGFWLRLAAVALDVVLIGIVSAFLPALFGGFPLLLALYSVVMWATKGTTIGGIVCGLKVVRLDDRPVDWSVALVRGLMAFVSLVVAGLGFIWVAFDDERQSWHDKVAGTTIVRVPKGTALL